MPVGPFQKPSLRPARIAFRSAASAMPPAATSMRPAPRSIRPPPVPVAIIRLATGRVAGTAVVKDTLPPLRTVSVGRPVAPGKAAAAATSPAAVETTSAPIVTAVGTLPATLSCFVEMVGAFSIAPDPSTSRSTRMTLPVASNVPPVTQSVAVFTPLLPGPMSPATETLPPRTSSVAALPQSPSTTSPEIATVPPVTVNDEPLLVPPAAVAIASSRIARLPPETTAVLAPPPDVSETNAPTTNRSHDTLPPSCR